MAKIIKQAYTFDDVLLVPNKSEILLYVWWGKCLLAMRNYQEK